jgi:hypothetical protein
MCLVVNAERLYGVLIHIKDQVYGPPKACSASICTLMSDESIRVQVGGERAVKLVEGTTQYRCSKMENINECHLAS